MNKDLMLKGGRLYKEEAPAEESPLPKKVPARDLKKPPAPLAPLVASSEASPYTSPRPEDGALSPLAPLPLALRESFVHLTEKQFEWLAWRMGTETDDEASELAGILSVIPEGWRSDPLFESAYQRALDNKREAFRVLGTHLLPKALRVINKLLQSDSIKANTAGLQFLLKTQALLDAPQKDQSEQVARLLDALRVPGHVAPIDIKPRE